LSFVLRARALKYCYYFAQIGELTTNGSHAIISDIPNFQAFLCFVDLELVMVKHCVIAMLISWSLAGQHANKTCVA